MKIGDADGAPLYANLKSTWAMRNALRVLSNKYAGAVRAGRAVIRAGDGLAAFITDNGGRSPAARELAAWRKARRRSSRCSS